MSERIHIRIDMKHAVREKDCWILRLRFSVSEIQVSG